MYRLVSYDNSQTIYPVRRKNLDEYEKLTSRHALYIQHRVNEKKKPTQMINTINHRIPKNHILTIEPNKNFIMFSHFAYEYFVLFTTTSNYNT